jgi:hypothetical protein
MDFLRVIATIEVGPALLGARWAVRVAWTLRHTLAAAGGAMFTYAWHAFPEQPVLPTSSAVDLAGNAIFVFGAVLLMGDGLAPDRRCEHHRPQQR